MGLELFISYLFLCIDMVTYFPNSAVGETSSTSDIIHRAILDLTNRRAGLVIHQSTKLAERLSVRIHGESDSTAAYTNSA